MVFESDLASVEFWILVILLISLFSHWSQQLFGILSEFFGFIYWFLLGESFAPDYGSLLNFASSMEINIFITEWPLSSIGKLALSA